MVTYFNLLYRRHNCELSRKTINLKFLDDAFEQIVCRGTSLLSAFPSRSIFAISVMIRKSFQSIYSMIFSFGTSRKLASQRVKFSNVKLFYLSMLETRLHDHKSFRSQSLP